MATPPRVSRHPMHCSYDADADVLYLCEFGTVPEERMEDQSIALGERIRVFLRRGGRALIGFRVQGLTTFDVDSPDVNYWGEPCFRVPALGLRNAGVAEIVLRARTQFAGRSTADVAAADRGHELLSAREFAAAEHAFHRALEAGLMRARLGLVSALSAQGRYAEAYDHARIFTELAPRNSWAWAWLGRTCVETGALIEAKQALRRAISLEGEGSYETPARDALRSLSSRSRD